MAKARKGDVVVAIKDIGGLVRELVPAGSQGVVTSAGWGSTRAMFTVKGILGGTAKKVEIRIEDHEYR